MYEKQFAKSIKVLKRNGKNGVIQQTVFKHGTITVNMLTLSEPRKDLCF
jgi:hypothetical protein